MPRPSRHRLRDAGLRAQVEHQRHRPRPGGLEPRNRVLEVFRAGRGDRHVIAVARERQRGGRADAIGRARDERCRTDRRSFMASL